MAEPSIDTLFIEVQEALAGEYSLDRELGRGGMGVVYLAREVRLAREVALKVLPPEMAESADMRAQFVREAQMAARLSHPNIVPIHRVGEAGAFVYFAMVYVPGLTLGEHLRTRGPLVPDHAIRVLREVAWALTYAHASGLVHRDIKPDNIMLEQGTGRVLVTDFGIAHASHVADELARDGRIVGTAHYMSPEQAMGDPVDARSDIYSLGVVAFHALTGRLPFEGSTTQHVLARHMTEPPPPMRTFAPAVPQRLVQAVECCLAKHPSQRFQRASDFAEAIEQSVAPVREIPAPIRLWLAREDKSRAPRIMGALYGGGAMIAASRSVVGTPLLAIGVGVLAALAIVAVPTIVNTRKVLRAGYSLDDLRESLRMHWARRREELVVEVGESTPITLRTAAIWTGVSASLGVGTGMLVGGPDGLGVGMSIGVSAMFAGVAFALVRTLRQRRAKQTAPVHVRLWESKWGERIATLCSFRLRRVAAAEHLAPAATEVALGRATDAMYDALPGELKKQLQHVPATVRRLEGDATVLRKQVHELESSIAALDNDARHLHDGDASAERRALRDDLQRARERSSERLGTTVAALETIRLGLMRLQLGAPQTESVTAVLEAARGVAADIDRAAEAQRDVERLLSTTQSFRKN